MPKAGTYARTHKKKTAWCVRPYNDPPDTGWQIFNHTTGTTLEGYYGKAEIAERVGRAFFGCDPAAEVAESGPSPVAQAAQAVPHGAGGAENMAPDVPPASPGPEPTEPAVDVPQGEVRVEDRNQQVPVRKGYDTPEAAIAALKHTFRAKSVTRPAQH